MKPTLEEVLAVAEKKVSQALGARAKSIPQELQEEMRQEAYLKIIEGYERLDEEKNWEAWVGTRCFGEVIDYLKQGKGFVQHKAHRLSKEEKEEANRDPDESPQAQLNPAYRAPRFKHQVDIVNESGKRLSVEEVLAHNGKHTPADNDYESKINWGLVSRMASMDHTIHLVAKVLLGHNISELSGVFGVTRERLSQRYHAFLAELSSPKSARDPWLSQAMFAFGVGEDSVDNGLGYDFPPIDLYSLTPINEDHGVHASALRWVEELYPDMLSVKRAKINWDMVSRMARYDEGLHIVAAILMNKSQKEICEYFDIGVDAVRRKVQRFIEKLDSPALYGDIWIAQIIYALGLSEFFHQAAPSTESLMFIVPIDLGDFTISRSNYDRGEQMSFLVVIPGKQLNDGSELKKTRGLRKVRPEVEKEECCEQASFLEALSS